MTKTQVNNSAQYNCEHCKRSFVRESTVMRHMCEPKRRWQNRNNNSNRIGFAAYTQFYAKNYNRTCTYEDFIRSNYYTAFVKFGDYCARVNAVNVSRYTDYLLDNRVSIDNWAQDKNYTTYLVDYLRHEAVTDAVRRTADYLQELAEQQRIRTCDVLRYSNHSVLCNMIVSGKISPWVIWNTEAGQEFIGSLDTELTEYVYAYIDPERWRLKFMKNAEQVAEAQALIKQRGL